MSLDAARMSAYVTSFSIGGAGDVFYEDALDGPLAVDTAVFAAEGSLGQDAAQVAWLRHFVLARDPFAERAGRILKIHQHGRGTLDISARDVQGQLQVVLLRTGAEDDLVGILKRRGISFGAGGQCARVFQRHGR